MATVEMLQTKKRDLSSVFCLFLSRTFVFLFSTVHLHYNLFLFFVSSLNAYPTVAFKPH